MVVDKIQHKPLLLEFSRSIPESPRFNDSLTHLVLLEIHRSSGRSCKLKLKSNFILIKKKFNFYCFFFVEI